VELKLRARCPFRRRVDALEHRPIISGAARAGERILRRSEQLPLRIEPHDSSKNAPLGACDTSGVVFSHEFVMNTRFDRHCPDPTSVDRRISLTRLNEHVGVR
jgi:hypothetical protein